MAKLFAALVAVLCPSLILAQAFGVQMGKSPATYAGRQGYTSHSFKITVPQPHNEFESYSAISTEADGICKVWATGRNHSNDRYGEETRSSYDQLKTALSQKYGDSQDFTFLKSGALWKDADEWVMAIKQKERFHTSFWTRDRNPNLPLGVAGITLEVEALDSNTSYIDLTYEFTNFPSCQQKIKSKNNQGL